METKLYHGICKQLNEQGEGIARIATLDTRDKDGDVLRPGCCGEQTVPLLVAHQWDRVPVGKVRVYEGPGAMLADFKINMALGRGKELYSALRFDLDTPPPRAEWSFGFRVPEGGAERGMFQGQPVRFLKRLEILEVSPVVAGAGIATATLSLKADSPLDQAALAAMEARVRGLTLKVDGTQDQAEVVRSALATLARAEQLQIKLLVADFQRICERAEKPFAYKFVPKGTRPQIERAAARFASWAAADLGIQAPEAKLFVEARAGDQDFRMECGIIGVNFSSLDTIAVHADLGPETLAETVAHEVAHCAGADEAAADEFAKKFVTATYRQKIGSGGPRAGRPSPGMTYDEKGIPSFGREDETRVIVTHRSF